MKICYIAPKCVTQNDVKVCKQLTRSLSLYLPVYAINKAVSITVIIILLALIAYTCYLTVDIFRKKEPTIEEQLVAYKRQKEIDNMHKDLDSKKPRVNVKHENLL